MKSSRNNRKKFITKTLNRRISASLAFILLFQTIFSGVEVRAQEQIPAGQAVPVSQEAAVGETTDATQQNTQTVTPYSSENYTLTIDKSGAWGGHAQYSITITNTSDATLENIALALPWQDVEVDAIWSATATNHQGTIYILPLEWCENLTPGANFSFGIILKGDDDKLDPPEKHALITSEQVTAIQDGTMQPPAWEELQTPEPQTTSEPTASPLPTPAHTTEVECTPEPINTPDPTTAPTPTAEPTNVPAPTTKPTLFPTVLPTETPTPEPTATPIPTTAPTAEPTKEPDPSPAPTAEPTALPTPSPEPWEDLHVDGALTLTKNTTCRNLYMNGTRLDTNGYKLTVTGNVFHQSGTIYANIDQVPFIVKGNYKQDGGRLNILYGAWVQIHGNYTMNGDAECRMRYDSGCYLDIHGNWTINTEGWNIFETGTIRLGGNLTQTKESHEESLKLNKSMNLILDGTTPQTVQTAHGDYSYLANLDLTQADSVQFTRYIRARSLQGLDSIHNQGILQLKITQITLTQNETIHDDLEILGGNISVNGHTLTLEKNLTMQGGWLEACEGNSRIQIHGNLTQKAGTLAIFYGGNVTIKGNCHLVEDGELYMREYNNNVLDIRGNWLIDTEGYNILEKGTIRLGGNLTQTLKSDSASLSLNKYMNLILDGTTPQTVQTAHGKNSYLAGLNLQEAAQVKFCQPVYAHKLDGLSKIKNEKNLELRVDNLSLTQDETIHDNLELLGGEIYTNGYTLTLEKNLHMQGGWLEAYEENSQIYIHGNLTQEAGTLVILYGAHIQIQGSYTMSGNAECRMRYDSGCFLDIRGNWLIATKGHNIIEAGTICLGGNLTQTLESDSESLSLGKNMNLILDGTASQTIQTAHEESSYLANVDVTQADAVTITEELYARTIQGLSQIANTDELMLHVSMITPDRNETLSCDLILDTGEIRLYEYTLTIN